MIVFFIILHLRLTSSGTCSVWKGREKVRDVFFLFSVSQIWKGSRGVSWEGLAEIWWVPWPDCVLGGSHLRVVCVLEWGWGLYSSLSTVFCFVISHRPCSERRPTGEDGEWFYLWNYSTAYSRGVWAPHTPSFEVPSLLGVVDGTEPSSIDTYFLPGPFCIAIKPMTVFHRYHDPTLQKRSPSSLEGTWVALGHTVEKALNHSRLDSVYTPLTLSSLSCSCMSLFSTFLLRSSHEQVLPGSILWLLKGPLWPSHPCVSLCHGARTGLCCGACLSMHRTLILLLWTSVCTLSLQLESGLLRVRTISYLSLCFQAWKINIYGRKEGREGRRRWRKKNDYIKINWAYSKVAVFFNVPYTGWMESPHFSFPVFFLFFMNVKVYLLLTTYCYFKMN